MKLYDCTPAPSPKRVRMFIHEKSLEVEKIQIDLMSGQQRTDDFKKINPWSTVPVLELEDGTTISEISACCRYIEEMHPNPPLLGKNPKEKAVIEMWNQHMEMDGFMAAVDVFRNSAKGFASRAKAGPNNYEQIPALADRASQQLTDFFDLLNQRLGDNKFIVGDDFSVADITAFVTIEFAKWSKITPSNEVHNNLKRWFDEINERPSSKA